MSFLSAYLKERLGAEVIERPEGFVAFRSVGTYMAVVEVFIAPEMRGQKLSSDLIRFVEERARQEKLQGLWTQVWAHGPGASETLSKAIHLGFRVIDTDGKAIIMTKEFGGHDGVS